MAVTDVRWLRRRRPVFRWEAEGREEPADEARRAPVSASLHLFALSREQLVMSAAAAGHQHVFMLVFIFFS